MIRLRIPWPKHKVSRIINIVRTMKFSDALVNVLQIDTTVVIEINLIKAIICKLSWHTKYQEKHPEIGRAHV